MIEQDYLATNTMWRRDAEVAAGLPKHVADTLLTVQPAFLAAAMEAIQAATYWPAKFMGVEKDSGTIAAGKYADIIAVRGDVLRTIALLQNPTHIMKGGTLYKQGGVVNEAALTPR